jgi:predicted nucleic acid-binding protein
VIYLLDASVLIPLLVSDHVHHEPATAWAAGKKMAVCPLVELAYLRTATGTYKADQSAARKVLTDFYTGDAPQKIPVDLFPLDTKPFPSSKKSTDWFLCELAEKNGMKLATFDRDIQHAAAELVSEHPSGQ